MTCVVSILVESRFYFQTLNNLLFFFFWDKMTASVVQSDVSSIYLDCFDKDHFLFCFLKEVKGVDPCYFKDTGFKISFLIPCSGSL